MFEETILKLVEAKIIEIDDNRMTVQKGADKYEISAVEGDHRCDPPEFYVRYLGSDEMSVGVSETRQDPAILFRAIEGEFDAMILAFGVHVIAFSPAGQIITQGTTGEDNFAVFKEVTIYLEELQKHEEKKLRKILIGYGVSFVNGTMEFPDWLQIVVPKGRLW